MFRNLKTRIYLKSLSTNRISHRTIVKKTIPQSQEELDQMPVFQYVGDSPKRKTRAVAFVWGYPGTGALGDENYMAKYAKADTNTQLIKRVKRSPGPLRCFTMNHTIYDAAAGSGFTVVAATERDTSYSLFGCGLNTDSQLGLQMSTPGKPLICIANMVPINLPLAHKERVAKVACGRAHTVCLTNRANVYTLGNNSFGQCGRRAVQDEKYFGSNRIHHINTTFDTNDPVVNVICGLDHTLFITKSGEVYSCGWNSDGQLGNGTYESVGKPTKVKGDIEGEKIVAVSCAADCVLAINDKGQVFGWGNSEYNQLAMATSETQVNVSRYLNLEAKVGKVISVAAGGSMCGLVNESGIVYVWGYGLLGLGPKVSELKNPTEMNPNLFGRNVFNKDTKVIHITAGRQQFGAINNRHELFTWGQNSRANLGTGADADMMFPFRVSIANSVTKVSFGADHTISIGRTIV